MADVPGTTLNSPPRFGQMSDAVREMFSRYPSTVQPSVDDFSKEYGRLRAAGYSDQETSAMMQTFAKTQGLAHGTQATQPSYAEGEVVAPGQAYTPDTANQTQPQYQTPAPFGQGVAPDWQQTYTDLLANQMRAGRIPSPDGQRFPWSGTNL
jgi:hypothetical protein